MKGVLTNDNLNQRLETIGSLTGAQATAGDVPEHNRARVRPAYVPLFCVAAVDLALVRPHPSRSLAVDLAPATGSSSIASRDRLVMNADHDEEAVKIAKAAY
ncbi:hypothetical protein D9619_004075 [Psilocybe cf. subviscida]|uniref:Uncharacterized protein n=1 Tax=Psilocybe cf. subviscida TaxID=2480587 RepID=A0A8H5F8G4_9AGAR|nr:hypothetical protein D9619_004075 [Psilocybe cf. subviscida]